MKFPNLPKKLFLFWDGGPMSWLQTRTVTTFNALNPDWEILVYVPSSRSISHQKYIPDYVGYDHFPALRNMEFLRVVEVDFTSMGLPSHIPDILRSDILRYELLYEHGGVWSDFDVIWLKPMSALEGVKTVGRQTAPYGATVCFSSDNHGWHNIGVMASVPGHPFYGDLIAWCRERARGISANQALDHQEFGVAMVNRLLPTLDAVQRKYPDMAGVTYDTFYPYGLDDMESLWQKTDLSKLGDHVMALHWFNGHPLSKRFLNGSVTTDCTMTEVIRKWVMKIPQPESRPITTTNSQGSARVWKHDQRDFIPTVKGSLLHTDAVLELGCGIQPMNFFQPKTRVLVDPFEEYVQLLRHKYGSLPGTLVLEGEALTFTRTLGNRSFDSVFLLNVLEHLSKEDGLALLQEMERIARAQVVVSTSLGFARQAGQGEGVDGWGLSGVSMQKHRSSWSPSDFPAHWRVHLCENYLEIDWKGEPTSGSGVLFAILTRPAEETGLPQLSEQQVAAQRFMPPLVPDASLKPNLHPHPLQERLDKVSHSLSRKLERIEKRITRMEEAANKAQRKATEQKHRPRGLRKLKSKVSSTVHRLLGKRDIP